MFNNLLNSEFLLRARSTLDGIKLINPFERCFSIANPSIINSLREDFIPRKDFDSTSWPVLGKPTFIESVARPFYDNLVVKIGLTAPHNNIYNHTFGALFDNKPSKILTKKSFDVTFIHYSIVDYVDLWAFPDELLRLLSTIDPEMVEARFALRCTLLVSFGSLKALKARLDSTGNAVIGYEKTGEYTSVVSKDGGLVDVKPILFNAGRFDGSLEKAQHVNTVPVYFSADTTEGVFVDKLYAGYIGRPEVLQQWEQLNNRSSFHFSPLLKNKNNNGVLEPYLCHNDINQGYNLIEV